MTARGPLSEEPKHVSIPNLSRVPPRLTKPPIPRWEELPSPHREELLRILGRMLSEQIDRPVVAVEVTDEPR